MNKTVRFQPLWSTKVVPMILTHRFSMFLAIFLLSAPAVAIVRIRMVERPHPSGDRFLRSCREGSLVPVGVLHRRWAWRSGWMMSTWSDRCDVARFRTVDDGKSRWQSVFELQRFGAVGIASRQNSEVSWCSRVSFGLQGTDVIAILMKTTLPIVEWVIMSNGDQGRWSGCTASGV